MAGTPELGEFVVATVKKIMPYGAFCALDEYGGVEGFVHVSQVSTGWVRNIREYLREGQKIVAKVSNLDAQNRQIDLSMKQTTESDKRRKLDAFQGEKKARKLIEVAGAKLKKPVAAAEKEIIQPLIRDYESLGAALEALKEGTLKTQLPEGWASALKELVEKEMKTKRVQVRAKMELKFLAGDGVEKLRAALAAAEKAGSVGGAVVKVHYLGAPNYFVDAEADDYKAAQKALELAEKAAAASGGECTFDTDKE